MNLTVETWPLSKIKPYDKNAKLHRVEWIAKSISEFKVDQPIVVDGHGVIIKGHGRLKAAQSLGLTEFPVVVRTDLTPEQIRLARIADNRSAEGGWDSDLLGSELSGLLESMPEFDFNSLGLNDDWFTNLGVDLSSPDSVGGGDNSNENKDGNLLKRFIIPPFSIFDTRQGYWRERKERWKAVIKDFGESRQLTDGKPIQLRYKDLYTQFDRVDTPLSFQDWLKTLPQSVLEHEDSKTLAAGVSILDPVLAEIIVYWFCPETGKTFDCFAGDSVFGYVSGFLGNTFTGIELRQEQATLNQARVDTASLPAKYICDDGQNVLQHIPKNSQDLLFSCPPYFDLEIYSDLPNDASNQKEYAAFLQILDNAFTGAIQCLKENRFAVIVVGDVRDRKGFYYRFPDDIKNIFHKNGMMLYNEIILVEQPASAAIRANNAMKNRKVIKTHQNILVFYKGNPNAIKKQFPEITVDSSDIPEGI